MTPYPNTRALSDIYLWSGRKKIVTGALGESDLSLDGGIHGVASWWQDALGDRNRYTQNYHYPIYVRFYNCMEVPHQGEIKIRMTDTTNDFMSEFGIASPQGDKCVAWREMTNVVANYTSNVTCTWDSTNKEFSIRDFDTIMKRTVYLHFSFIMDLKLLTTLD